MPINQIHTYLVHARKGAAGPQHINGASVPLDGRLFELLHEIYQRSEHECDIDITFVPEEGGQQRNACRDLICAYLDNPTFENGRPVAERLERNTDKRSGIGLLFLIAGRENGSHKIVISRFPTDHAIYVDENPDDLTVEFLERVFMKNKASYKAVSYRDASLRTGFWNGRAIDRQLNSATGEQSNYWIMDFLASVLTVTAAAGTRRLALALRKAAKDSDLNVKQEINACATLAIALRGQRLSINEFADRFALSEAARTAILQELKTPELAQQRFEFDSNEFSSLIAFKSVELNNGGMLTAPSANFNEVFRQEQLDDRGEELRFTTEGRIVNEKLKSSV